MSPDSCAAHLTLSNPLRHESPWELDRWAEAFEFTKMRVNDHTRPNFATCEHRAQKKNKSIFNMIDTTCKASVISNIATTRQAKILVWFCELRENPIKNREKICKFQLKKKKKESHKVPMNLQLTRGTPRLRCHGHRRLNNNISFPIANMPGLVRRLVRISLFTEKASLQHRRHCLFHQ